jgi:phage shock protein C
MKRLTNVLRNGMYRSRDGVILGVCKGIAEYFDFSVFWTRAVALLFLLLSGFWPTMAVYFIAALLMKPKPVIPLETREERDFYDSYVHSKRATVDHLKRRYERLERRIQQMEHTITSREFDWDQKLKA